METYTEWTYLTGTRSHHRYYRGTEPFTRTETTTSGLIEKHGDAYRWALYLPNYEAAYGEAPTLAAAKRAVDQAERNDRLTAAEADVLAAIDALATARAAVRAIKAER